MIDNIEEIETSERRIPNVTKKRYLTLLGENDIPLTPESCKTDAIFLGPELLGEFENAMLLTNRDKIERFQDIEIDRKTLSAVCSPLLVGDKYGTGNRQTLNRFLKVTHLKPKALIDFHTHPKNFWPQSRQDVATARGFPNIAFIHLVGSDSGISGLLQTESSLKSTFNPLTQVEETDKFLEANDWPYIKPELADSLHYYQGNSASSDQSRLANILARQGLMFFKWNSPHGVIRPGDMSHGINLKRIPTS